MKHSFMLVILIMSQQSKITSERGFKGCYRLVEGLYCLEHLFIRLVDD